MKAKESNKGFMLDSRGFSLVEVLLGITVFMIGMLGVTALNISSLKSTAFSGNISEALLIGSTKIEEIMAADFEDVAILSDTDGDGNGVVEDTDDDGVDDQLGNGANFGLDDTGANADYTETGLGKLGMYTIYWNVAESEPITVTPTRTKTIQIFIQWQIKTQTRQISMSTIRMRED